MKKTDKILVYDNSFNGFLSAIYQAFQERLTVSGFKTENDNQVGLFSDTIHIQTNQEKARRVWDSLQKKNYSALKNIYFAFLSETSGIEYSLYQYIRYIFLNDNNSNSYDIENGIVKINQMASLVSREKQRLESQIQLNPKEDDVSITYVEPSFNVLPLVSKHIRSQHHTHPWIIFDIRRNYGMFFNGRSMQMISHSFLYRIKKKRINSTVKDQDSSPGVLGNGSSLQLTMADQNMGAETYSAA